MGLVLTRKKGQAIILDGPAIVRLVRTKGGAAVIRIEAPRTTAIVREEISEARKQEAKP